VDRLAGHVIDCRAIDRLRLKPRSPLDKTDKSPGLSLGLPLPYFRGLLSLEL
jgi:hypothetical protein